MYKAKTMSVECRPYHTQLVSNVHCWRHVSHLFLSNCTVHDATADVRSIFMTFLVVSAALLPPLSPR